MTNYQSFPDHFRVLVITKILDKNKRIRKNPPGIFGNYEGFDFLWG